MKKTIISFLALFFTSTFSVSSAMSNRATNEGPAHISTLIINSDVTVVLTDNHKTTPEISGSNALAKNVIFKKTSDTLIINSARNKNLKGAGVIYIPASHLKNIRINSEAHVRSLFYLQIPRLNVVVNGACKVAIYTTGVMNVGATEDYAFDRKHVVHPLPKGFYTDEKSLL